MVSIYIPPDRRADRRRDETSASAADAGVISNLPDDIHLLTLMEAEVDNFMHHLERSNRELAEADPDGQDSDFQTAIKENVETMGRKSDLLASIRQKIAKLEASCSAHGHVADSMCNNKEGEGEEGNGRDVT